MTKVALLTGGSRGIGAATKALLEARGWKVLAPSRQQLDVKLLARAGFLLDLKRLDALVLCAGEWKSKPLAKQGRSDFFGLYLAGHWQIMVWLLPALERAGGCVIGVASTRAFIGGVETAAYSAEKAGLVALMQGFAREYGHGVRFNAVCPSLTATDMEKQVRETGGCKPDAVAQPPEAVAGAIVGLIESDANGKVLRVVDGAVSGARWTWE